MYHAYTCMSDLLRTAHAHKGCAAIDTKFTSIMVIVLWKNNMSPRSTTSGQHLWPIASLSTADKYNCIRNVLEKMLGCTANRTYTIFLVSESLLPFSFCTMTLVASCCITTPLIPTSTSQNPITYSYTCSKIATFDLKYVNHTRVSFIQFPSF